MPAGASAYSRMIVFGDSLSDSGQFPDVESLASGEIQSLRFTNRLGPTFLAPSPYGEVSTQRLARALGLEPLLPSTSIVRDVLNLPDGTNYATGGYITDDILGSITRPEGSVVGGVGVAVRSRDGYLVTVDTADPDALYYLNGGGNDFLDGVATDVTTATTSAATLAEGVTALVSAGAKSIVVANLPDVGATPAGAQSGQRESLSALTQVFNQALGERLAQYDGQVNIIRLDVGALFDEVISTPGDFGLAENIPLSEVCFSAESCDISNFGLAAGTPDPSKLLFNDTVHPTTIGQEILADYAYAMIEAPRILSLSGGLVTGSMNAQQQLVGSELRPGQQSDEWRIFVHGDYRDDQAQGVSYVDNVEAEQRGAGIGAVVPIGQGWLGATVTQREGELEAPADVELEGLAFSLFARQHLGRLGGQAIVTQGDFDLELRRRVSLGMAERTLSGETSARSWAAELRLDYRLTAEESAWYTSPFIAYRHIAADIDGYREAGSMANALIVSDQELDERRVEVGLMMDRSPQGGIGVFAELAWGEYLNDENDAAEVRLASLPTNRWSGEGGEGDDDHYLRLDTGLRLALGNTRIQAGAGIEGWDNLEPYFQLSAGFSF
ncbi:autotransporter domain-containing protein [Halomonas sp. TRM85114]|uniref:autotransporter domain-containing protein n=1 Tax=Halomonas jincaotanensis TaxID=2810616 RepID=UPI001BD2D427|nr:autotransporter domain-containing SGNH/GDSL hydrolase family protein [Halomonas jincaotanensis]MBS9404179.1 autotransporter domain-containing protein [Halomonas jincaotanensis]